MEGPLTLPPVRPIRAGSPLGEKKRTPRMALKTEFLLHYTLLKTTLLPRQLHPTTSHTLLATMSSSFYLTSPPLTHHPTAAVSGCRS